MFNKKILVVDDTEFMQIMMKDILEKEGYKVISARNGEEGLKMVDIEKPDLVILDVVMPGISGFEVCKILRENESNNLMPIIMLTAKDDEEDKLKGLELGADDYIVKPFNERELISRVRNTLRRIDRNRYANPLTGLSGNMEIQEEITRRLAQNEPISVIYADLDNFKAFNDVYGFAKGDTAIKMTADIIKDAVHAFGNKDDFIGHIGGDDFIIVSDWSKYEDIAVCIIADFDKRIKTLYTEEHENRGYIVTKDRRGRIMEFPIMTISIAIVTNEHRKLESMAQISEIIAEVKKRAKKIKGSIFCKDRRRA